MKRVGPLFATLLIAAGAFGQTSSASDTFDDPQILSSEQRFALLEVASALKFIRVWGSNDVLVTKEAEVPKRLAESKPDAVYHSKMSELNNPREKRYEWVPVEIRRYGRLLLGFKIGGNGQPAEKYMYWGYDKAGSKASQVDRFYGALQGENLQEVRRLSSELAKSASLDSDMECGWYGLEARIGDPSIAKRISAGVSARKDPLTSPALFDTAAKEGKIMLLSVLSTMIGLGSTGCADR